LFYRRDRSPTISALPIRLKTVYYSAQDVSLTGILTHLRSGRGPKPSALQAVLAVCLVLLMLLAAFHVVFGHSVETAADHCPICTVMHSVVPFLVAMVAVLLVRIGAAPPVLPEVRKIVRYWHPILFTRPPPAGC
jgi:hypothetical protein